MNYPYIPSNFNTQYKLMNILSQFYFMFSISHRFGFPFASRYPFVFIAILIFSIMWHASCSSELLPDPAFIDPFQHFGSKEKIMKQIIKKMVFPNPKFRIICRHSKFVPQEFFGIWKVGIYADIAKEFHYSEYFPYQFEHENITEAELIIEKRKSQVKNKNYIVREYRES